MINRWLGFPIMILCFALLFAASFMLGKPISSWLGWLLDQLAMFFEGSYLGKNMPGLLAGLLSDGFLRGVGSALAFFPQMLLFFIFYTIITDTGYDARISYIMHGPMSRWLNMNGNCFAPLVLGYSCNVPAIVSAADIPDRVDRRIIMLVTSFVPCSARLGVIIYLAGAFFNP
jgi:ferrous iron transport protein B